MKRLWYTVKPLWWMWLIPIACMVEGICEVHDALDLRWKGYGK